MNEIVAQIEVKFNAFSLRERALILLSFLALAYGLWYVLVDDYFLATDAEIKQQSDSMREQIGLLEGQIDSLSAVVGRNPTAMLIKEARDLKQENDGLDKKIEGLNQKMISADRMSTILKNLIDKSAGLTLVSLESLATKPLFDPKNILISGKPTLMQAFSHGLKIEMMGGYFETLQFLKAVESQAAGIVWDHLTYSVVQYPVARITIELHTIGLDEGWISV